MVANFAGDVRCGAEVRHDLLRDERRELVQLALRL
jgi:hypothetical protein